MKLHLVSLTKLARENGESPKRMIAWLRAYESSNPAVKGLLLVRVGKRGKRWVNADLLRRLETRAQRDLQRRVAQLEAWAKGIDTWRDELDAQRFTGKKTGRSRPISAPARE